MFDGILFDLDGTLWDATAPICASWNDLIARHAVPRPPVRQAECRGYMGLLLDEIARRLFPMLEEETRQALMSEHVAQFDRFLHAGGAVAYPGAEEVLSALARRSRLFVVSNCQDGYIQDFYALCGLGGYFTDLECAGRTGLAKGDNIALVVRRHGLRAPVYVGDTQMDCDAAGAAGVPFVHAAYGFGRVEAAVPAVQSLGGLPEVLSRLSPP